MYFYNFEAFSAPCELHIGTAKKTLAENAARTIYFNAKRLEKEYSFFTASSQLGPLNYRTTNSFTISDELASLIELAFFYTDKTKGAFDIATAGTLKQLSDAKNLKQYNILKETLSPYASSEHIQLHNTTLSFDNNFTKIDFGGLVKEYAVDQSVLLLKEIGIDSALVNFGGDIAACGTYDESAWNIGIQNPKNENENLKEIKLNENSLCTSGHSKRFHTIENKTISHIISSIPGKLSQISLIAPTTVDAGVWCTALLANPLLELPSHILPALIL